MTDNFAGAYLTEEIKEIISEAFEDENHPAALYQKAFYSSAENYANEYSLNTTAWD